MSGNGKPEWALEGSGWALDRIHFDRPVTQFTKSFYLDAAGAGSGEGFESWSLPIERYRFELVNGWAYGRAEPFGGEPPRILEKLPFLAHLWRVDPRSRKRMLGFDRFVREGGFERNIDTWANEWKPEAERRAANLGQGDPASASDDELALTLEECRSYCEWAWTFHLNIHFVCFYVRGRFRDLCRDRLGLSDFEAYELLKRSDPDLIAASRMLAGIARRAAADDDVRGRLELPADQALAELRGTWFEQALDEFLDAEGDRSGSFELSDPTWREMPELVVGLVKSFIDSGYDPVAEDEEFQRWRSERVEELRGRLDGDDRAEFDRWLDLGERAYPLNETHNRLLIELPWARARYAGLEAGRRLAAAGRLERESDVFHLSAEELIGALRGTGADPSATAASRRAELERAATLDPPAAIGPPPMPPPFHALPDAVSEALKVVLDQSVQMVGVNERRGSAGEVVGSPGSPGTAEGPARVVRAIEEFDRVQAGDILVCPLTNPSWTVLFPRVAGLVTDSGGALSHAAIVAREYGVPSVVGALDATRRLQDGQIVRIDGEAGVARVVSETGRETVPDRSEDLV